MARPLRIALSGGLYHVTSRGDRREDIYFGVPDRQAWLQLLGQVCKRFNENPGQIPVSANIYPW